MTKTLLVYAGLGIVLVAGAYYVFYTEKIEPQQSPPPQNNTERPSISDRNVLVTRRVYMSDEQRRADAFLARFFGG